MTPWEQVEADRLARRSAWRKTYRPNGGAFVVTSPDRLVGEMRNEELDALNYGGRIKGRWRVTIARWLTWMAAVLLTVEIREAKP
mgnify:CR=1 FL=1